MTTRTVQGTGSIAEQGKRGAIIATCITAAVLVVAAVGIWRSEGRGGPAANTVTSVPETPATAAIPASPSLATIIIVESEEEAAALLTQHAAIIDVAGNSDPLDQVLVVKTAGDAVHAGRMIEDARTRLGNAVQVIDRRPAAPGSGGSVYGASDGPVFTP